ncbi:MAG: YqeG family HAD IIIA-type phosphatase [Candidatus Margulisbacteria bacterium]|nr:YqeG family HAD IIIA-type phosphatase [Candidatus Margulisiibacteriota bacterium]
MLQRIVSLLKLSLNQYTSVLRFIFTPNDICEKVEDIQLETLVQKYPIMLLDVDNTILPYTQSRLSFQKLNWINRSKALGFKIYLISNNISKRRIEKVAIQLGVTGIYFACKPFVWSIKDMVGRYDIDIKKCVVIGDQMSRDVVLGNWLRCHTILVDPLDKKVSFLKTVQRDVELFLLKKLNIVSDY